MSVLMIFLTIFVVSSMGVDESSPSTGAGAGTTTVSSISSIACADSTSTKPFRFKRTLTLSLVLVSGSLDCGTGPISKLPTLSSAFGGNKVGVVYRACTANVSLRKKVIAFNEGTVLLRSNNSMSFASPSSACQVNDTGKGKESITSKSRTLNWGESIAPCSAHPRATHSLALSVREHSMPKKDCSCVGMKGILDAFPTSSTALMSSGVIPLSDIALITGAMSASSRCLVSSSIFSRVIDDRTSLSSIRHSMLIGASGFEDRTFFIFSTAMRSLRLARAFDLTSIFWLTLNSSQKWSKMA
mmetsp:Transcript_11923/g.44348  ORF Transcript_11923/g.44348 Transcript_11923/m.44348 type:complete len:300 (-) Transcript_11923:878-1777(-)